VRQSIRGYTDAIVESASPEALAVAAQETAWVVGLLADFDDLRLALLDPGVPAASRRRLLEDLLGARLSEVALRPLLYAVEHDRASDTVDDIKWLASHLAGVAGGGSYSSRVVLGRKASEERLEGYVAARFEGMGDRSEMTEVEEEIFRFARALEANEALAAALSDPDLPLAARSGVVADLLRPKARPATTSLALYALSVSRPRDYPALLDWLVERLAAEADRRVAEVRCAAELTPEQAERLGAALALNLGHPVEVRALVDPSLLAGFVATIGDLVVDASARRRLEQVRERLVTPEVRLITGDPN
jgi:F-type H+-transporting ATPase subunit delta